MREKEVKDINQLLTPPTILAAVGGIALMVSVLVSNLTMEKCDVTNEPWGSSLVFLVTAAASFGLATAVGRLRPKFRPFIIPACLLACGIATMAFLWSQPYACITYIGVRGTP